MEKGEGKKEDRRGVSICQDLLTRNGLNFRIFINIGIGRTE